MCTSHVTYIDLPPLLTTVVKEQKLLDIEPLAVFLFGFLDGAPQPHRASTAHFSRFSTFKVHNKRGLWGQRGSTQCSVEGTVKKEEKYDMFASPLMVGLTHEVTK